MASKQCLTTLGYNSVFPMERPHTMSLPTNDIDFQKNGIIYPVVSKNALFYLFAKIGWTFHMFGWGQVVWSDAWRMFPPAIPVTPCQESCAIKPGGSVEVSPFWGVHWQVGQTWLPRANGRKLSCIWGPLHNIVIISLQILLFKTH